jgi:hypothetical protein
MHSGAIRLQEFGNHHQSRSLQQAALFHICSPLHFTHYELGTKWQGFYSQKDSHFDVYVLSF